MAAYGTQNHLSGVHMLERRTKDRRECGNNAPVKIPDEVILAMRTMHEIDRKPCTQVQAAYPQYSKHYVRDILNYTLRAHLRVTKIA